MDFIILAFPIRPLWKIQASVSRRVGIIATVTVGGIAVIVSCLRIIILHEFAINPDFTYVLGKMIIISSVELNVAITAANVPSFKAIWRKHVTGTLKGNTDSVNLSSLARKGHSGGSGAKIAILCHSREREVDQSLPYFSSTNNLVERPESDYELDSSSVQNETNHSPSHR